MNILEILLIFLSTLIFIPPVLFFSQMNKEIIKKKNMIGIIPQAGSSSNETTEEKTQLVQSYEYLGLKEENSQKDFNEKIIEKTTEKFETIDAEVRGAQAQASEAKSVADNCLTDIDNLQKSVNGFDSKLDEKVEKEFGKGLSTNDYNNNDKSRVEALNSIFNEKNELILNEEKIQLSQPYVDLELTAEHSQKHFNEKVVEKIKKLAPKEQAQPKRVTEIKDNTFDYKELSKYDNRVLIRSNERDEYMDLDSFGSSKNFITTLVKGSGKGKIHITLDRKTHTIEATKGNYAVIIVNNNDKIVRLFNKYYPYTIVRSSKYVNFIESAKTTANVFEFLNIGQKKGVSVSQSDVVVVLCYKETKPDYTKNIIKLNIDKNNFSQRINNINYLKYDIRGVVLTTDDVYNPESKHNVYISNSEEYTTEEFPKEIVIDVAGKQNYNIFYLVNVEPTVNPESVVGLGDFELTLNKGFLSY
jgi:hypothetical protein